MRTAGFATDRPPGVAATLPSKPLPESLASLKARLDLPAIVGARVALERRGQHQWWGRCCFHSDSTPSLLVDTVRGTAHCFGCSWHGDGIDFLREVEGLDTAGAVRRARELAGDGPQRSVARRQEPEPEVAHEGGLSPWARRLWHSRHPITPDCPAARYYAGRGCPVPPNDVGWLPCQAHPDGYAGPAILALITDVITGEPVNVHRTWLKPNGAGKAEVDRPKRVLKGHRVKGGVVRLWPDEEVTGGLLVAEGLETALSGALAFGLAWATVNSANMAALPVLPGVEALTIISDHDQGGIRAAEACAERWAEAGREVRVWRSERPGWDFNDRVRGDVA